VQTEVFMHRSFLSLALLVVGGPLAAQEARLLRFPAVHGDSVVFSYAGNLYSVPAKGGVARRLTSHEGYEMFARFSPDGSHLAFTGQYDGNTEVYVMLSEGSVPKRLTYTATLGRDEVSDRMGPNNIVMTWKNNDEIVFRSRMREWNDFIGQLYTVNVKGGLPRQLPLPRGGLCSFAPDGKRMAYNRIFREFRTWKRYRGGLADDIWIHDFETKKTTNVTNNPSVDDFPMWHGDNIYFLSDRADSMRFNLFVHETTSGKTRQLTHFTDFDIKFPSLGDKAIAFEYAGYVYLFDLATEKADKVPIRIQEDLASGRTVLKDVSKIVSAYEISNDGRRALFAARGDLFTVPAKEGQTRNLTRTSGVHERNPKWSPDGKSIAFISDKSGEDEIHVIPAGGGADVQITEGGPPYKYMLRWSPDSKKILWADKLMRLFYVDVASKKVTQIDESKTFEIRDYVWSPDSRWVAYAKPEPVGMQKVYIHSLAEAKSFAVTKGWHQSMLPEFSGDGKYLFFVSECDFKPTFSDTEWNHVYVDMECIYLVTLGKDTPSPLKHLGDEEEPEKQEKKDEKREEKKKEVTVKIDTDGIADRTLQLPVPPGVYRNLQSAGRSLYYMRSSRKGGPPTLYVFDLTARKDTSLGPIGGFEISADGKKMLVRKDSDYHIIDLPKSTPTLDKPLKLSGMDVQLDRHAEWRQIFNESWRQMRDFFYDPGMHGVDWPAVREKYRPLVDHVNHRADLTYVIGEMISELDAGHAYVGAGDLPKVPRIPTGLLGAELEHDAKSGAYKITKILKGSSWDKELRSPLAELGVGVKEGDLIVGVNDQATRDMVNIYESLLNTAGKQVRLKVQSPGAAEPREVTVVPIGDEQPLYYHHWVEANIKKVSDATGGKVGYVHVPDMQAKGLNQFARYYYPQLRKQALIIDVRGNGGGNVSPMLIERLRREIAMVDISRDTQPRPDPYEIMMGPKVCLMNEYSASDGDLFPYRFRHYKLGKLIGKRSWGGVIGIRGSLPFVDGGSLNKPEFSRYDLAGKKWIIENHGVDPDIFVDNDPWTEYRGTDQQLDRAIAVILEELRQGAPRLAPPPPFPKR
jgi:tricorn protease